MKFVNTDLTKKNRKMLLTINNPNKVETTPQGFLFETDALSDALNGNNSAKEYIVDRVKNYIENSDIIKGKTSVYYCFSLEVGEQGTPHLHIFFNFENPRVGNKIKKIFPTAHLDYCNGSNQSCRDYVFKTGKWESDKKEDTRINNTQYENGELPEEKGQGSRTDLEYIQELVEQGKTPQEILEINPNYYLYTKYIGEMFYAKRCKETPVKRDVTVTVHTGVAGSGKTNVLNKLCEQDLYIGADYSNALFDGYEGQKILFLDEFRGQMPYNQLLQVLDGYKLPVHARYFNKFMLWTNVHITSVIALEDWYNTDNIRDTFEQLKRRVSFITYHYMYCGAVFIPNKMEFLKHHNKNEIQYGEYTIPCEKYVNYETLEREALAAANIKMRYNAELEEKPLNESEMLDIEYREWLQSKGWKESSATFAAFWSWKIEQVKANENVA